MMFLGLVLLLLLITPVAMASDNELSVVRISGVEVVGDVEISWGQYHGVGRRVDGNIVFEVQTSNIRSRLLISAEGLVIELTPVPVGGYKITRIHSTTANVKTGAYIEIIERLTTLDLNVDIRSRGAVRVEKVTVNNESIPYYNVKEESGRVRISLENLVVDVNREVVVEIILDAGRIYVEMLAIREDVVNVRAEANANVTAVNIIAEPRVVRATQRIALSIPHIVESQVEREVAPVNVLIARTNETIKQVEGKEEGGLQGGLPVKNLITEIVGRIREFKVPLLILSLLGLIVGIIRGNRVIMAVSILGILAFLLTLLT